MTLEEDVSKMNKKLDTAIKNQHSIYDNLPGIGLYVICVVGMVAGIKSCSRTEGLNEMRKVRVENVIGAEAPEKFYEINGQRFYSEVDGKPVESHFKTVAENKK